MKLEQQEKLEVQNLLKLIKRAKFDDFLGTEALALARAYSWLLKLLEEEKPQPVIAPIEEKPVFDMELAGKAKKKK